MKEQLLTAWATHNGKNQLLLQHLPGELLSTSMDAKGRSIAEQLAHMHNVRINWIEFVAKPLYQKTLLIPKDVPVTNDALSEAFTASGAVITTLIDKSWEKEGKLPSFKAGLIPFISYLISHESHHRGNILITAKQKGLKLPGELRWGLWEWAN